MDYANQIKTAFKFDIDFLVNENVFFFLLTSSTIFFPLKNRDLTASISRSRRKKPQLNNFFFNFPYIGEFNFLNDTYLRNRHFKKTNKMVSA